MRLAGDPLTKEVEQGEVWQEEGRQERDHTLKLASSVEEGEDLEQKINCCDLQIV